MYQRDGLPDGWIYEDERWSAGGFPLNDVPGWIVMMLRRHVEHLTDLSESELETFGPVAARLSSAIAAVVPAIKVYVVVFVNDPLPRLLAARTSTMTRTSGAAS